MNKQSKVEAIAHSLIDVFATSSCGVFYYCVCLNKRNKRHVSIKMLYSFKFLNVTIANKTKRLYYIFYCKKI